MIIDSRDPRCQTGAHIQIGGRVYQVVGPETGVKVNYGRAGGVLRPGLFVTGPLGDVAWISAEAVARSWVVQRAPLCPDVLDDREAA